MPKKETKRIRIIGKWRKNSINQIKCNGNNGTSSSSSYPTAERHAIELRVCIYGFQYAQLLNVCVYVSVCIGSRTSSRLCNNFFFSLWTPIVSFTHFYLVFIRRFVQRIHKKTTFIWFYLLRLDFCIKWCLHTKMQQKTHINCITENKLVCCMHCVCVCVSNVPSHSLPHPFDRTKTATIV